MDRKAIESLFSLNTVGCSIVWSHQLNQADLHDIWYRYPACDMFVLTNPTLWLLYRTNSAMYNMVLVANDSTHVISFMSNYTCLIKRDGYYLFFLNNRYI
jgi:hypothetical protein